MLKLKSVCISLGLLFTSCFVCADNTIAKDKVVSYEVSDMMPTSTIKQHSQLVYFTYLLSVLGTVPTEHMSNTQINQLIEDTSNVDESLLSYSHLSDDELTNAIALTLQNNPLLKRRYYHVLSNMYIPVFLSTLYTIDHPIPIFLPSSYSLSLQLQLQSPKLPMWLLCNKKETSCKSLF